MTRNHPLTNFKNIYPPILPRFLPSISFADHLVPRRVTGRGCFLSSLQLWRLSVPEFFQDAFSCEYLDHAKSGFKRRIVSLMLDQKLMSFCSFDDGAASYDESEWLKSNYREYLCTIFVERSCAKRMTSKAYIGLP